MEGARLHTKARRRLVPIVALCLLLMAVGSAAASSADDGYADGEVFLSISPYMEADKEFLVENTAQIADVESKVNAHRFADQDCMFTYRLNLEGLILPAELRISTVGAQYKVSVSNDGETFTAIAVETERVKDESNKTRIEYRITQDDLDAGTLFVRFEDSFPEDGWGASFRRGPLEIVHRIGGAPIVSAPKPRSGEIYLGPDNSKANVFLWTTPYMEQDKAYLVQNTGKIADAESPQNAHRYADGEASYTYCLPLDGLKLPAWLGLSSVGGQYKVSVSNDDKNYEIIAVERRPVRDESNRTKIVYTITAHDVASGSLYVRFEDSNTEDGWGASFRGGPLVVYSSADVADGYSYFPVLERPERLYVIRESAMDAAEFLTIISIQGIVAQDRPEIYIQGAGNYGAWVDMFERDYGIPVEYHNDPMWFIEHYRNLFETNGYILTALETEAVNVATTAAGVLRAPIVDESLKPLMDSLGFEMVLDTTDLDEAWAFDTYKEYVTEDLVVRQEWGKIHLRDYAIATKAFTFYDLEDIFFMKDIYDWVRRDIPLIGWGPGSEGSHIGVATMMGLFTVPADWALNLTVFPAVSVAKLSQPNHVANIRFETDVHYVTFVMSDGDNVQWFLNDMPTSKRHYGSDRRGEFPMGFTISPSLADLAPTVMKWYYDTAKLDYYVAGISGTGYMYPVSFPELDSYVDKCNEYLERSDLSIVSLHDPTPMNTPEFLEMAEAYARQPNVLGGIYLTGRRYAGEEGNVVWADGKPFVGVRESLWTDDPVEMAGRINSYAADPSVPEGYTIVNVHPWSHSLDDVATVIDNLAPHVRVVNPEEFFLQMIYNLGGRFPTVRTDVEAKISSPVSREKVSGIIDVCGNASSSSAIAMVLATIDDMPWIIAEGADEWNVSLDTRKVADGPHALRVIAFDEDGKNCQVSEEIMVMNQSDSGTVVGWVMYAHSPVAGAAVYLGERTCVTDQDGRFEFKFVPSGMATLKVQAEGFTGISVDVAVAANQASVVELAFPVDPDTRRVWTFDEDADGWKGGYISPGAPHMGKAKWDKNIGDGPGSLCMDGSDYGYPDGKANAWFYNIVKLPVDAENISYKTRGNEKAGGIGGGLRLVLVDEEGEIHELTPWEASNAAEWVVRTADISEFAGRTVVLRFEQDDLDVGISEHRWVDNVIIR